MDRPVGAELHHTVPLRKKGKIVAAADKITRIKLTSPLPDNDASGTNDLPPIGLHPRPFRLGIASVSRTALSFCMCHLIPAFR